MAATTTRDVLAAGEFAERFGISTRTVRRMIADDEIPAFRLGGQWRIPKAFADQQVAEALERHEQATDDGDLPGLTSA